MVKHFNEDGFSHGLVQGLADRLERALEGLACAEHAEGATVVLSTQGVAQTLNDISVEVRGCCPEVVAAIEKVVSGLRVETTGDRG